MLIRFSDVVEKDLHPSIICHEYACRMHRLVRNLQNIFGGLVNISYRYETFKERIGEKLVELGSTVEKGEVQSQLMKLKHLGPRSKEILNFATEIEKAFSLQGWAI